MLGIPHRTAVVWRETVTIDIRDIDVARTERHLVAQQLLAAGSERAGKARDDLAVGNVGMRNDSGLDRLIGKDQLNVLIPDRLPPLPTVLS